MSHPGSGPDMNPSGQQPGQPGQPIQPGQPGQPYQPYQPFEQQPGAWTPPGGASPTGEPAKKSGLKKALPIVGGVVVAGAIGAGALGLFGMGEPEVGDCVKGGFGGTEVESVDCESDEAENKVVGIEENEMTYDEFMENEVCTDFESAMSALWYGPPGEDEDGTVYCAEPV